MKKIYHRIVQEWITAPFAKFIRTGLNPPKLALSFSLGICLGITPLLGTTTLTCTIAAVYFRLNFAAIQLINYMVYPLQILLLYPFLRAGSFITGSEVLSGTTAEMTERFRADWWQAISELGLTTVVALGIWALISVPLGILLYKLSFPVFTRMVKEENKTIQGND